jgi:hypothetical protein
MSESEENTILKKVYYGACAFLSLLAMILVIISVATTNWVVSTFPGQKFISYVSVEISIGFFQYCYNVAGYGTCTNLTTPISAPSALLILGLIILAFNIVVCLVLAFIKVPPVMTFVPVVLLFLSSIFILAGYSISWYYICAYMTTTLPTTLNSNNIFLSIPQLTSSMQGITVGYSYKLSVAGHFFTYVALAIAAFTSGQTRIK